MKYNISGLSRLDKSPQTFKLTGTGKSITLPLNPETFKVSSTLKVSNLEVIDTSQPLILPQSGSTKISVTDIKLYTPWDSYDLDDILSTIDTWCKSGAEVSIDYGKNYKVYILSWEYIVQQYRVGKATKAQAGLEMVEIVKPVTPKTPLVKKLTRRELGRPR